MANEPSAPYPSQNELQAWEESQKLYVTSAELFDWLSGELDTTQVKWDGWAQDSRVRAAIVAQHAAYVPLVQNRRLDRIVSRDALALTIARSALGVIDTE